MQVVFKKYSVMLFKRLRYDIFYLYLPYNMATWLLLSRYKSQSLNRIIIYFTTVLNATPYILNNHQLVT